MRTSILAIGSLAVLLLLTSCAGRSPKEDPVPAGPQDPNLSIQADGYHGNHFNGPLYAPRYSPMGDGTTVYNVTYQNGVTILSRKDTLDHLVAILRNGNFLFNSSASQIANLKPGSVLLLTGLAVCTVDEVKETDDGYLLKTEPAKITDAIKDGRLDGTYKIDFSRLQAIKSYSVADYDVNFDNYNYHVKFIPRKDRLDMQATIKFGGSQGVLAYEGVGYLSNFISSIRMQITDGEVTNLAFTNSGLAGQLEFKWYAAAKDVIKSGSMTGITSWPAALLKSASLTRAAYNVPIRLGALPFDLKMSLGFSFIPALTSKNSVVEGSKLIKYSGNGGFRFADGQTMPSGSMDVQGNIAADDSRVVAAGPVGFTAAAEAPRLDLAMGWPPSSLPVAGYLNFVTSYGIVTNGWANKTPCQTNIMAFSVNAGSGYTSPNSFADWVGSATGVSTSVSLWQKTLRSAGTKGVMCPE
jgi:hypothetical protein